MPPKFRLRVRIANLEKTPSKTLAKPGTALLTARTAQDRARPSPTAYPPIPYCPADFLLACRYAYYCCGQSIVSDAQYDSLEEHYISSKLYDEPGEERGRELRFAGSDRKEDYLPHERALAMYFIFRFAKREDQPQGAKLKKHKVFKLASRSKR